VALMVNSLGATTVMELNIAARHALVALANMQARSLHPWPFFMGVGVLCQIRLAVVEL